jgi:hypothetical protein
LEKNGEGGIYNMRKYVIGFLVGVLCASVAPAYGAVSSLVGKKVSGEYTVKVDGTTLSNKSVAIDGTTYAPLRAIGDATGYDVSFENKTVVFTKKESESKGSDQVTNDQTTTENPNAASIAEIDAQLTGLRKQLINISNELTSLNAKYMTSDDETLKSSLRSQADVLKEQYKQIEAQIKELESRKAELEGK